MLRCYRAMSEPGDLLTRGARIADVATAILIAGAAWCALVATPAVFVRGVLIFPPAPLLLLYAAACVQIARHLLWPQPSVPSRVKRVHAAVLARPNVTAALRAFIATRFCAPDNDGQSMARGTW